MTDHGAEYLTVLAQAQADLDGLAHSSEAEIDTVTRAFKSLADAGEHDFETSGRHRRLRRERRHGHGSLQGAVVVPDGEAFLGKRLEAATTILEDPERTRKKLLTAIDARHRSPAGHCPHLQALSVLTNVEVAHLGSDGGDFQLLAQDLSSFSKSVSQQTEKLASNTESRQSDDRGNENRIGRRLAAIARAK